MSAVQQRASELVELLKADFLTRLEFFSWISVLAPPGSGGPYFGTSAPAGYLLCDGSAVSRTTYAALFAIVGVTYGAGDGSTTFNLPDLRQRFPLGKAASGTGNTLGATGGAIDHVHTGAAHTHQVDPPDTTSGAPSDTTTPLSLSVGGSASSTHTHQVDIPAFTSGSESAANTGSNNAPFLVVNWIIKT